MKSAQQHQWTIRPATNDDIAGVCELINAYSLDVFGHENDARRNVDMTWKQPNFDLVTDTRLVIAPDGRIAGYGEVEDTQELHVRVRSWFRVHPDFKDLGIDQRLLDWIEERAPKALDRAPAHARVVLSQGGPDEDASLQTLLHANGFRVIRHFWRMTIELDQPIPEPVWPEGVSIRTFVFEDDLEATVHACRDSFQDHWGHIDMPFEEELRQWDYWIREDKQFDPTLNFLAIADGKIVGLSLCDPKFSEDPDMGFIEVLGTCRGWRRKGIALALLRHSFREFQARGQKRVGLGVDATSLTGANKLYEVAGMTASRQFNAFEKELRAGKDLSVQSLEGEGVTSAAQ